MTKPSGAPDYSATVAKIREASRVCRAGGPDAFDGFRDLVSLLLCLTIGHKRAAIHLARAKGPRGVQARMLTGGHAPAGPDVVRLSNERYLRLVVSLYLGEGAGRDFPRTSMSLLQYQLDEAGDDWVFRYEYKREPDPAQPKPVGHLHVRGKLASTGQLAKKQQLKHVHFPCGRPTIEGVIRLLADDFHVPTNAPDDMWRPALAASERDFLAVAHKEVQP